jgi:hypothetical protein
VEEKRVPTELVLELVRWVSGTALAREWEKVP